MAISNFIPEIWSERLLINFRKSFVFANLVNRDYEGEIQGAGDTVHINTPNAITVNDYAGTVTYETPTSTQQTMTIDQQKYWALKIGDVNRVQANVQLMPRYVQEAVVAMADTVDQNLAAFYTATSAGAVALDVSVNNDGVRDALLEAAENLDSNNIPSVGRWVVVSPRVMRSLKGAPDYSVASELGDDVKMRGALGMIEGFNIYMSNNVPVATQHKCMYGTNAALTFAEQFVETEALRLESEFTDAMRGLLVFGRRMVRPDAAGYLDVTV